MALLEVHNLCTHLTTDAGVLRAVDHVNLTIEPGETLAVVGESGCGKSMLALSLLRLIPEPPARIVAGQVWLQRGPERVDLVTLSPAGLRAVRGGDLAMIFQEPMTALNPVLRVGEQIAEVLSVHRPMPKSARQTELERLLTLVGIPEPALRLQAYPHELSGGMRQRVMIAMALAGNPRLLIADEPTTALDVTIQAQILGLLQQLQRDLGMALLIITHDLGVVAHVADRVAVMYAGRIVEQTTVNDLFATPQHPYTCGLLQAVPRLAVPSAGARLATIPGRVPHLARLPQGCAFQDRCPKVQARCRAEAPTLDEVRPQQWARCWYPG